MLTGYAAHTPTVFDIDIYVGDTVSTTQLRVFPRPLAWSDRSLEDYFCETVRRLSTDVEVCREILADCEDSPGFWTIKALEQEMRPWSPCDEVGDILMNIRTTDDEAVAQENFQRLWKFFLDVDGMKCLRETLGYMGWHIVSEEKL